MPFKFLALIFIPLVLSAFKLPADDKVMIDCSYTLSEALEGKDIPDYIKKNLVLIDVQYYSFDKKIHQGQLVLHKDLQKDIEDIFGLLLQKKFPVAKAIPVVKYDWNDNKSMLDNNTSAFNYRKVKGFSTLSSHATGRAIDINPLQNPQIRNGKVSPEGAQYNKSSEGTILRDSFIIKEFTKRGWKWGGYWKSTKDYQHFEKKII